VNSRLVNYLEENKIIPDNQFGFRRGRSTEDAVLKVVNTIAKALDINKQCIGVFVDLAKAFDTVSIPILLRNEKKESCQRNGFELVLRLPDQPQATSACWYVYQ
jgi:hypothetical protein